MKKIISSSVIVVCTIAIYLGFYNHQNTLKSSDLVAQNIEALALFKGDPDWVKGYTTGTKDFMDKEGNMITIDCCVPSVQTDACDAGTLGCQVYK